MADIDLALVGDVQINREDPETTFEHVNDLLQDADLRVCQLEATVSDKGTVRSDVQNPAHRVPPEMLDGLVSGEFDAVTYAGNNQFDYGSEALFDTINRLQENNIGIVGVGKNIDDAREPIYLERNGTTVAIVNVCSLLRSGYEATETDPGLAPLHVSTFYETLENKYEQPATPPRTVAVPDVTDLQAVTEIISEANKKADYVIGAFHWGVHFTYDLANYQAQVAYEAIDSGADVIVGTHPHNLQAVDVYKGKPIFYSLGNFVFDQPENHAADSLSKGYLKYYGMSTDSGAENYPHPRHTRETMVAKVGLSQDGIEAKMIPVKINVEATPKPVDIEEDKGEKIYKLLKKLSGEIGTDISEENGEIILDTDQETTDTRVELNQRMQSYPWLHKLQIAEYSDSPITMEDLL